MKIIRIIGHPATVMALFLLIMISGEHLGGFYMLYILLGLPYGAPHSLIAVAGLLTMLIGYKLVAHRSRIMKPVLCVIGILLMVLALITFFERSKGYNDSTFDQAVPIITLSLFSLSAICCIIFSVYTTAKNNQNNNLGVVS